MLDDAVILALLASSSLEVVAAERLANSASIPLSTNGAVVGDILIVICYQQSGTFSVSGTGWTSSTGYSTAGGTYTGAHHFKTISATTDVTTSGSANGFFYCLLRGPQTAALAFGPDDANTASRNVDFPDPDPSGISSVIITAQQAGDDLDPPDGYLDEGYFVGTHNYNLFTLHPAPDGPHTDVLTGIGTGIATTIYGFELRG